MTGSFLLTILACAISAPTSQPQVELLGQPCRAFNVLAGRDVIDPTGKEWLVLTNMNEVSGCELIFIDFRKNTAVLQRAPAGQGAWALMQVDDKLVAGTFYDGQFMTFDLKQMKFVRSVGLPGEKYIWGVARGSDGRIYGGSYPGGKLGAMDLNSYAVQDLGAPAAPNLYLRNVSSTPDGRIVCSFGTEKPVTMVFDPKTGKFEPAPKTIENVQTGVAWGDYFLANDQAFAGEKFTLVEPLPFPAPPKEKGSWNVDTYASTRDTLFLRQGTAIYRYAKPEKELTLVTDRAPGARLLAGTSSGEALMVRGPEYFVIAPGEREIKPRRIPIEPGPRVTHFLQVDDQQRLWGGPTFGQTLFWLDTKTRHFENTGVICNSGGEVYDVTFLNGKVYAVAYSGGDIVEYDPSRPWDQLANKNPRTIAHLADRGYIRPIAGVVVTPNGKLLSGWMAKYGTYGGAVSLTDPSDGKTELIENPLGPYAIAGVAVDDMQIYVGTSLGANGLSNKKGDAPKFGVIDLATRKVVFEHAFPGAAEVSRVVYDRASKRVFLTVSGRLVCYVPATKEFVSNFAAKAPTVTSHTIDTAGDGRIVYAHNEQVVSLDLTTGVAWPIAAAPHPVETVAVDKAGNVYVSCGPDIYRIQLPH
jgi:streptogramin lyase